MVRPNPKRSLLLSAAIRATSNSTGLQAQFVLAFRPIGSPFAPTSPVQKTTEQYSKSATNYADAFSVLFSRANGRIGEVTAYNRLAYAAVGNRAESADWVNCGDFATCCPSLSNAEQAGARRLADGAPNGRLETPEGRRLGWNSGSQQVPVELRGDHAT